MLITFFVLILAAAVGCLIFGLKTQRWIMSMISTILFMVLAFQGFAIEIVSGGVTLVFQEIILVYLCWGMIIVGAISTVYGVTQNIREQMEEKKKSGV